MASEISSVLQSKLADTQITTDRVEYVGPAVGKHLSKQAMYAFSFVFMGIIVYVAFRFKSALWGIVGVLALIHDVFVTFGVMVLTDRQIDLTLVAALLTIVGYSISFGKNYYYIFNGCNGFFYYFGFRWRSYK